MYFARRLASHTALALAEAGLIALLIVGLVAGTAFAARGGHNKPIAGGYGSCYVTPDPVAVGGKYTVAGSGLKAGQLITVWVTDSHGTQTLFPPVDSNGNFTASSYSSWAGSSTVNVYDNSGRRMVWLHSCGFQVG